jgi:hypothetical protein
MGMLHLLALWLVRHQKRIGHRRLWLLRRGVLRVGCRLGHALLPIRRIIHRRLLHLRGWLPVTMDRSAMRVGLRRLDGCR